MTDIEIEKLIRVFKSGVVRRSGVRVDAVMCGEVLTALKELKKRKSKREVEEHDNSLRKDLMCPSCQISGYVNTAKYNGYNLYHCKKCGMCWIDGGIYERGL